MKPSQDGFLVSPFFFGETLGCFPSQDAIVAKCRFMKVSPVLKIYIINPCGDESHLGQGGQPNLVRSSEVLLIRFEMPFTVQCLRLGAPKKQMEVQKNS